MFPSSLVGISVRFPGISTYAASKAGLMGLVKGDNRELYRPRHPGYCASAGRCGYRDGRRPRPEGLGGRTPCHEANCPTRGDRIRRSVPRPSYGALCRRISSSSSPDTSSPPTICRKPHRPPSRIWSMTISTAVERRRSGFRTPAFSNGSVRSTAYRSPFPSVGACGYHPRRRSSAVCHGRSWPRSAEYPHRRWRPSVVRPAGVLAA